MPPSLGRAALLVLAALTLLASAWLAWTQQGAWSAGSVSWWACSATPLLVAGLSLVALFAPFDDPASAPRWVAPLVGLAGGLALGGLVMYTASFVWLGPPLVAYAALLHCAAAAVARGANDESDEGASPGRGLRARAVLALVAGLVVCWALRAPPGEARPLPNGSEVISAATSASPHLRLLRVARREDVVTFSGNRIEVSVSLERPRVEVTLRKQAIVIEPCLTIEQGTTDGAPWMPLVNGYRAAPGGRGPVELAESRSVGWARITYPQARVEHEGSLAPALGGWGRPPADALAARLDIAVDLDLGRVTIDALTTVPRALTARRASLGRVRFDRADAARLRLGLAAGLDALPPDGGSGPAELLVTDGGIVRAMRARRGDEGPFETFEVGEFDDWLSVEGLLDRFLLVIPDWDEQASLAPSRAASQLPQNALAYWRDAGQLHLALDVTETRAGPGLLSTEVPPGIYRDRIVLLALDGDQSAATRARAERLRVAGPGEPTAAPPGR